MTSVLGNVATTVARAAGAVVEQVRSVIDPSSASPSGAGSSAPASGWLAVTVNRDPAEIDTDPLPAPLAEFGDRIEVRIRPAADGKGTEIAARLQPPAAGSALGRLAGSDPQGDLRSALRRAKQLVEVGEVLKVDPAPHGKRSATPGGMLLEAVTKRAPRGGVL